VLVSKYRGIVGCIGKEINFTSHTLGKKIVLVYLICFGTLKTTFVPSHAINSKTMKNISELDFKRMCHPSNSLHSITSILKNLGESNIGIIHCKYFNS
jgi:hypothetical protein